MNILVMGGSGLFGRKTIMYLLNDPDVKTVVSMDLAPPKEWFMKSIAKNARKFHFVQGNAAEIEDILGTMKKYKIDRVINWAFIMVAANEIGRASCRERGEIS